MLAHVKFEQKDQKKLEETPDILHSFRGTARVKTLDGAEAIAIANSLG